MGNNTRIAYIDIAKGIGILLVLLGHLLPSDSFVKSSIYAFHMPLFFFVVGGGENKVRPIREYALRRAYQVLIPYFLWAVIFAPFSPKSCAFALYGTNESLLLAHSNGMLWFLMTMFVSCMVAQLVNNRVKTLRLRILAIVCLIALSIVLRYAKGRVGLFSVYGLPLGIDVACLASAFILTGQVLIPLVQGALEKQRTLIVMVAGMALLATSGLANLMSTRQGYPQMATLDVGYISVYFVIAVLATMGILCLSRLIERSLRATHTLSWFGQNSLLIFITHRIVLYKFRGFYWAHYNVAILIVAFLCLVLFSSVCAMVIRRVVPNLAGQRD